MSKQRIDINIINAHDLTKASRSVQDEFKVVLFLNDKRYIISLAYQNFDTDQLQLILSQES